MKVIIQDSASRLYLGHGGNWTDVASEAKDFAFAAYAKLVGEGLGLKGFRVLFYLTAFDHRIVVSETSGESTISTS